jgi:hypothetical protein
MPLEWAIILVLWDNVSCRHNLSPSEGEED